MTDQDPAVSWQFEAIGTAWWIGVYEPIAMEKLRGLKRQIKERIEAFDKTYSRFRADSTVTRMAAQEGLYVLPEDSKQLFALYRQLYDLTGGAMTPLIGQTLSDAGYDAEYSLKPGDVSTPPKWNDVMSFHAGVIGLRQPVLLDFGAAGKGYLVDIISELLQGAGIKQFCVDASGDMVCRGLETGLRVGLENPADPSQVIGVITLRDGAVCGSAGNKRTWQNYTHILDPRTLRSPTKISAVWCQAADALTADGLATALFFTPLERFQEAFEFEYCIIYDDGTTDCSDSFQKALFASAESVVA